MINGKPIVKCFMQDEFNQIPKRCLMDIIDRIFTYIKKDNDILETWEKHFQDSKIPYAITCKKDMKSLWKERVI